MIRKLLALSFMMVLCLTLLGASRVDPEIHGGKCYLTNSSKTWSYNISTEKKLIKWKTSGPREFNLYVRSSSDDKIDFDLYIDGDKYKSYALEEEYSSKYKMRIGDGKAKKVTGAKKIRIKLRSGKHTIELKCSEPLFGRLVKLQSKSSPQAPEKYDKALALITGDTRTTYYSATAKKPIVLDYEGSGKLKIWTRLAFDKSMRGTQHYGVIVNSDDKKPFRAELETEISETSQWENDGDIIPGKARTFEIKLEKGKHRLEFMPNNTASPYCAMRFTITN